MRETINSFHTFKLANNELIVYNRNGELIISSCLEMNEVETVSNQDCTHEIKIKFTAYNQTRYGYLSNNGIIKTMSKNLICEDTKSVHLPSYRELIFQDDKFKIIEHKRIKYKIDPIKAHRTKHLFEHANEEKKELTFVESHTNTEIDAFKINFKESDAGTLKLMTSNLLAFKDTFKRKLTWFLVGGGSLIISLALMWFGAKRLISYMTQRRTNMTQDKNKEIDKNKQFASAKFDTEREECIIELKMECDPASEREKLRKVYNSLLQ